jgi:hypothetical protein
VVTRFIRYASPNGWSENQVVLFVEDQQQQQQQQQIYDFL